jgi:predicted O-methyltransferase YrrM
MKIGSLLSRVLNRQPEVAPPERPVEEVLAGLPEPYRGALVSMYRAETMAGIDGVQYPVDGVTGIRPSQGMWFYDQCCSLKPSATLEIGCAYGFSTVFFLAAIAKNGAGGHTAIDPFQRTDWHGTGVANVRAVGAESWFRLIEERSDRAATDLARKNASFDIIFIDGNHRLDDALVDFYLYAPLCKPEGLIILDDMWMNSIQTAASFIRSNRTDFVEVPTALPRLCVFKRVGDDLRPWDHFQPFTVAGNGQASR